jgi:hypothetical protein
MENVLFEQQNINLLIAFCGKQNTDCAASHKNAVNFLVA